MAIQTGILKDSVAAAKDSADAAKAQIKMIKDKERARLTITPQPLKEIARDDPFRLDLEVRVENVGYTHAFGLRFKYRCELSLTEKVTETTDWLTETIPLVRPEEEPMKVNLDIWGDTDVWDKAIARGGENTVVNFWGTADYKDVFGDRHAVQFHYIFKIYSFKQKGEATFDDNVFTISSMSQALGWKAIRDSRESNKSDEA